MGDEVDVKVNAKSGQHGPFSFGTGLVNQLIVDAATGFVLDIEDSHFNTDHSVLLPEPSSVDGSIPVLDERRITGLGVLHAAYVHAEKNSSQRLFVTGHTDPSGTAAYNQKLSEKRAENVSLLLRGDRDAWRKQSNKEDNVDDVQTILKWQDARRGWDCDPGPINNQMNGKTRAAIGRFQEGYNLEVAIAQEAKIDSPFKQKIEVDKKIGEETWGAFYDVYMSELMDLLLLEKFSELEERQKKLKPPDGMPNSVGCGEHIPFDPALRNNPEDGDQERKEGLVRDRSDRRVELPRGFRNPQRDEGGVRVMRAAALFVLCAAGCARGATPDATPSAKAPPPPTSSSEEPASGSEEGPSSSEGRPPDCDLEPEADCGAGELPRITNKDWSAAEIDAMALRSKEGSVAVDRTPARTRLVPRCKLDGAYAAARGEAGSGSFRATNRLVFRPSELGPECAEATHVVAAFVQLEDRFAAVLTPLPCPPSAEASKARGCLGRGLTGRERAARAKQMMSARDSAEEMEIAYVLEAYALWPDEREALSYAHTVGTKQRFDCFVWGQTEALLRLNAAQQTSFFASRSDDCANRPPFMTCFPGLFDPAPAGPSCWREP